jgi:hypothetical protein
VCAQATVETPNAAFALRRNERSSSFANAPATKAASFLS